MTAPLPADLDHLPRYGNVPVPFFTAWFADGRPNFRAHDTDKHNAAMRTGLCGICGRRLGYWQTFLQGPNGLIERLCYMPAMHRECALASLVFCPFLATHDRTFSTREVPPGHEIIPREMIPPKPDRVALVTVRKYEVEVHNGGSLYARHAKPHRVEWYVYNDDGALVPEAP